jgi:hypothetical protein
MMGSPVRVRASALKKAPVPGLFRCRWRIRLGRVSSVCVKLGFGRRRVSTPLSGDGAEPSARARDTRFVPMNVRLTSPPQWTPHALVRLDERGGDHPRRVEEATLRELRAGRWYPRSDGCVLVAVDGLGVVVDLIELEIATVFAASDQKLVTLG